MKKTLQQKALLTASALTLITGTSHAAMSVTLNGTTETEEWTDLSVTNHPGYNNFGTNTALWPSPIDSDAGSTGNADFDKISGGGYPSSESIYPFTTPGTFSVASAASLADVTQVVFQVDSASGNYSAPTLSYNGGSQNLVATFTNTIDGAYVQSFGGAPAPTLNAMAEWDLSGVAASITSFEVTFTGTAHDAIYQLNLDSSDGAFIKTVPEPSSTALLGLGGLALILRRRR